ncbi:hypothetical protein [Mucilaginibacter sp. KACC 22063]|uniref:hypothetical protein n=1 Tax=Mucilaginibacter sp. KACC 22063 TaxID=3025666 RepID=UPI002366E1AA|nr:hypothetical protein [Mucilaginibacter sp. KACC 22063]WDF55910.1 hypothetical protein PQ461_02405 [Mucilaginibacter sp. KACC 22063]
MKAQVNNDDQIPLTGKHCTPPLVFTNVITRPYFVIYLILIIAVIPAILFYVFVASRLFWHGSLPLSFAFLVLCMMLIVKLFQKKITIYFDSKSMYVAENNQPFRRILKRDIAGIYSFDYELKPRSHISIVIKLKNGKQLSLTDGNLFERKDENKALMLKQFIKAAQKRLNLAPDGKNKWRSVQGVGACWYAPKVSPVTKS